VPFGRWGFLTRFVSTRSPVSSILAEVRSVDIEPRWSKRPSLEMCEWLEAGGVGNGKAGSGCSSTSGLCSPSLEAIRFIMNYEGDKEMDMDVDVFAVDSGVCELVRGKVLY